MSDIVKGLYDRAIGADGDALLMDAADEIERLSISVVDWKEAAEAAHRATDNRNAEIERLRSEIESLRIALDLLTTLKPDMEIDVTDPVGMAQQIAAHVAEVVVRLRNALYKIERATFFSDEANQIARDALGLEKQFPIDEAREELGHESVL